LLKFQREQEGFSTTGHEASMDSTYRMPKNLNLDPLVGCTLVQLGLGRGDVQLNFDGSDIKISVWSRIVLRLGGEVIATWKQNVGWSSPEFQELLNATVSGIRTPTDRLLEIEFDNRLVLQAHDDSDTYESMQIDFRDGTFII
jgi:hypothetical protein